VSLLAGLAEALRMIDEEGFAGVLARHRLAAGLASRPPRRCVRPTHPAKAAA
jgi:hypothetical protein